MTHDTRNFFATRAAGWEDRFPDDAPVYAAAVAELGLATGDRVLDVGCGTGRALVPLRAAVGSGGWAVGVDVTPEMLAEARHRGRADLADFVLADALALPFPDAAFDAVFAAGLLHHLPDPSIGLRELARVCRPGARLGIFHPIGRAALAHRHGHELSGDEPLSDAHVVPLLADAGWRALTVDDGDDRYLTVAERA
jgi:SAM-dependent methyltransferase